MPRGDVGYGFAANFALVGIGQVSTHNLKHLINARTSRVHADMRDGDFASWRDQCSGNKECRRGRIAGNLYLLRF